MCVFLGSWWALGEVVFILLQLWCFVYTCGCGGDLGAIVLWVSDRPIARMVVGVGWSCDAIELLSHLWSSRNPFLSSVGSFALGSWIVAVAAACPWSHHAPLRHRWLVPCSCEWTFFPALLHCSIPFLGSYNPIFQICLLYVRPKRRDISRMRSPPSRLRWTLIHPPTSGLAFGGLLVLW